MHRFEKILSWAEFMNLHRDTEDDEENQARKAADDHDELGVAQIRKRAATKLKLDLDLSPKDVIAEELSDRHVYPEWDYRSNRYLPRNVRVLARIGDSVPPHDGTGLSAETRRRIRHVRRRFEALRPKRQLLRAQLDGSEKVCLQCKACHQIGEDGEERRRSGAEWRYRQDCGQRSGLQLFRGQ